MLGRVSPVTRVTLPACRAHYPGGPQRVHLSVASPPRAAFPVSQPGRRPRLHFRGLLRLHSRYGPSDRSAAQGGLCHEASARPVAQTDRSSATRSTDNSLGGTFLHWRRAPSGRTGEFGRGSRSSWPLTRKSPSPKASARRSPTSPSGPRPTKVKRWSPATPGAASISRRSIRSPSRREKSSDLVEPDRAVRGVTGIGVDEAVGVGAAVELVEPAPAVEDVVTRGRRAARPPGRRRPADRRRPHLRCGRRPSHRSPRRRPCRRGTARRGSASSRDESCRCRRALACRGRPGGARDRPRAGRPCRRRA